MNNQNSDMKPLMRRNPLMASFAALIAASFAANATSTDLGLKPESPRSSFNMFGSTVRSLPSFKNKNRNQRRRLLVS